MMIIVHVPNIFLLVLAIIIHDASIATYMLFYSSKEQRDTLPIRLLLDDIHDPMNFGAILRCAYYLGVDKIIAGRNKYIHTYVHACTSLY